MVSCRTQGPRIQVGVLYSSTVVEVIYKRVPGTAATKREGLRRLAEVLVLVDLVCEGMLPRRFSQLHRTTDHRRAKFPEARRYIRTRLLLQGTSTRRLVRVYPG